LDEGSGELLIFPRRGRLAGTEANNDIADPHRLPRMHFEIAPDAVALVEQA